MAAGNFTRIIEQVLGIEGGVSDRPLSADPGGLTSKGVTQAVYDQWRALKNLPSKSVREITKQEAVAIYKANYWRPVQGDNLPSGVDFAVVDYAINSGPAQAVKDLQRVLGCRADGIVGLATLEALAVAEPEDVINGLCDRRLAFMKRLKNWKYNASGWTKRVAHVRAQSLAMVEGDRLDDPDEALSATPLARATPEKPKPPSKLMSVWAAICTPVVALFVWLRDTITTVPDFVRAILPGLADFAEKSELAALLVNVLGLAGAAASAWVAWSLIQAKKDAH